MSSTSYFEKCISKYVLYQFLFWIFHGHVDAYFMFSEHKK